MEDDYYKILEIEKTASRDEIKKAYRQKALVFHPDKGGDEEIFKKITKAYEMLQNPKQINTNTGHGNTRFMF